MGRRSDGYHEIETILQTIDLHDEIELRSTPQNIHIQCNHPLVPEDETNLVYKSAQRMREVYAIQHGADMKIQKVIPVGAGLGGGSSNAAVVLLGLVRLWRLDISERDVVTLAAQIGSDVPFFLKGGTALATGRGQNLEYFKADWGEAGLVLVYPRVIVSSAWAYKRVKISLTQKDNYVNLKSLFQKGIIDPSGLNVLLGNDLEKYVSRRYPVIEEAKAALLSEGAVATAMTGSGSCVYGVFLSRKEARKAAHRIIHPEWDVFLTKPINPGEKE